MKQKISVLSLAQNDLKEIHDYLSVFGGKPPQKLKESFKKFCGQVSDMPYMFSEYRYNPKYRCAPLAYSYLVFYSVDIKKNTVKVYRILHDKRNLLAIFDESD